MELRKYSPYFFGKEVGIYIGPVELCSSEHADIIDYHSKDYCFLFNVETSESRHILMFRDVYGKEIDFSGPCRFVCNCRKLLPPFKTGAMTIPSEFINIPGKIKRVSKRSIAYKELIKNIKHDIDNGLIRNCKSFYNIIEYFKYVSLDD